MIKKLAWNTFKRTGNINTFLEFIEIENTERNLLGGNNPSNIQNNNKKDLYGNNQDKGNSTFRK